ncbi:MAG: hypothetical protein ACT4NU_09705 [Chromatiales bacterium]
MSSFAKLVVLAPATLLLSGCLTYTSHPLSPVEAAVIDQALLGDWRAPVEEDGGRLDLQITPDDAHRLGMKTIETNADGRQSVLEYSAHGTEFNGTRYLNVVEDGTPQPARGYLLVKYLIVNGKELHISLIDEDAVKGAIRAGEITGIVEESSEFSDAIITAYSDELAAFVTRRDADLFKSGVVLQRVQ